MRVEKRGLKRSCETHGLKLAGERPSAPMAKGAAARAANPPSPRPPTSFDRFIVLGSTVLLLDPVAGIGPGLGWAMKRLFGARWMTVPEPRLSAGPMRDPRRIRVRSTSTSLASRSS